MAKTKELEKRSWGRRRRRIVSSRQVLERARLARAALPFQRGLSQSCVREGRSSCARVPSAMCRVVHAPSPSLSQYLSHEWPSMCECRRTSLSRSPPVVPITNGTMCFTYSCQTTVQRPSQPASVNTHPHTNPTLRTARCAQSSGVVLLLKRELGRHRGGSHEQAIGTL